jgi:hypothetical protein
VPEIVGSAVLSGTPLPITAVFSLVAGTAAPVFVAVTTTRIVCVASPATVV